MMTNVTWGPGWSRGAGKGRWGEVMKSRCSVELANCHMPRLASWSLEIFCGNEV